MRIAMIGQKGLPARSGGIERHVDFVSAGLARAGHEVIVYGRRWYTQETALPNGVQQRFTRGIHTKHLDAVTHGITALWDARQLRPDIVHLQGPSIGIIAPLARLLVPSAKLVITFHCLDREHAKWNPLARLVLRIAEWMTCRFAHRTITVAQELAAYCQKTYGCQALYVTHPMPEMERPAADALAEFGLTKDQYFVSVSRLIPHKNVHVLLEAYARACERFTSMRDMPLVIVGDGSFTDGYVAQLKARAAQIPGVMMVGEQTGETLRALQAFPRGYVFPTASEGLAFSMLEAGALGAPVIMTDLPNNIEALGTAPIQVPVGDVEALATALGSLANAPLSRREEISKGVKTHVSTHYSYDGRIGDLIGLFLDLLEAA